MAGKAKPFEPPIAASTGLPCGNCAVMGRYCSQHSNLLKSSSATQRARLGWESVYLDYLRKGYAKKSAAGMANVSEGNVHLRARQDPEFAEEVEVAYNQGTAYLESIGHDRVTDPNNPGDSVLKHLLSVRGLHPKAVHEISGPGGGPIELDDRRPIPFDRLSLQGKRKILAVLVEEGILTPADVGEGEDGEEDEDGPVIDVTPKRLAR